MAKRPSLPLSIGAELVPPGPGWGGQYLFLEAVRKHVPEALTDLVAKVAPELPNDPFYRVIAVRRLKHRPALDEWCEQKHFKLAATGDDGGWLLHVVRRTAI